MKQDLSKPFAMLTAILLMGTLSHAQRIAPQSINTGGAKMSKKTGSLSFTVGELIVSNQTDNQGNTLSGGFIASATISTIHVEETDSQKIDIREPNAHDLDVKVYPNPTFELIYIQINHITIDQLLVSITDLQGKEVYYGKYAGISNIIGINTAAYAPGNYVLTLKDTNNQLLGRYKIIKH
ncbi:MAG: T9SS type A sorting domain-containing protein [Flavobacteriales bacterium]|nr:T9SS type A sorting domain-containing protein [Flavobacteriales bacterium]